MTREEIEKQPWFGEQRAQVRALLTRVESAEQERSNCTRAAVQLELERDEVRALLTAEEAESERMYADLAAAQAEATRMRAALLAVQRDPKHTGAASAEGTACACAQCAQVRAALATPPLSGVWLTDAEVAVVRAALVHDTTHDAGHADDCRRCAALALLPMEPP